MSDGAFSFTMPGAGAEDELEDDCARERAGAAASRTVAPISAAESEKERNGMILTLLCSLFRRPERVKREFLGMASTSVEIRRIIAGRSGQL